MSTLLIIVLTAAVVLLGDFVGAIYLVRYLRRKQEAELQKARTLAHYAGEREALEWVCQTMTHKAAYDSVHESVRARMGDALYFQGTEQISGTTFEEPVVFVGSAPLNVSNCVFKGAGSRSLPLDVAVYQMQYDAWKEDQAQV